MREGIISSEAVNSLGWAEEVFYRRLHSVVDDYGRYYADETLLRAACYPRQIDRVGNPDIAKWLAKCAGAGLVRTYTVDSKRYLEVARFGQHVRSKQSKFPPPPDDCNADVVQMHSTRSANAPLDVDVFGDGDGRRKRRAPPKTTLPENFAISPRVKVWASAHGFANVEAHFEFFVSKCRAKGYAYVDWDEGFMGAMRGDWAKLGKGTPGEKRMVM